MSPWTRFDDLRLITGEPLAWREVDTQDDDEIAHEYAALIGDRWVPLTDEEFNNLRRADNSAVAISNLQANTQHKMPKQQWMPTDRVAPNGAAVFAKIIRTKAGREITRFGIQSGDGIKTVSKKFLETGTHPRRRSKGAKAQGGGHLPNARAYVLGGPTRRNYLEGVRKFRAQETPKERRADRRRTDPLVFDSADYNPKENDMVGIDDKDWNKHPVWNAKAGGYMGRTKREPSKAFLDYAKARKGTGKGRKPTSGMGKGHYIDFFKENFEWIRDSIAEQNPGISKKELQRATAKKAGEVYRSTYPPRAPSVLGRRGAEPVGEMEEGQPYRKLRKPNPR